MCNRYASDIRKAGIERDYYGFDEWSETRINPMLGNAVLEVFPKSFGPVIKLNEEGKLAWMFFLEASQNVALRPPQRPFHLREVSDMKVDQRAQRVFRCDPGRRWIGALINRPLDVARPGLGVALALKCLA